MESLSPPTLDGKPLAHAGTAPVFAVPNLQPEKLRAVQATKEDAKAYLVRSRDHEAKRRAALPEWRRRLEDLLEFIPDRDRAEAAGEVLLLLAAINSRAVIDPLKLAQEATDAIRAAAVR